MAYRWAVINGNWSDTATWNDGGVLGLPTASDVVSPNQLRVTVDTNITVTQLTSARSGSINIQGGGVFVLNDGVTITAYGTGSLPGIWPYAPQASGSLLLISQSNSAIISSSMRMPGTYTGGTGGFGNMLFMTGSSNITVSGSISGVAYASSNGWATQHSSTGTLRIFGNVEGAPGLGSVNGANGITTTAAGITNITGDVYHHNFTANAANNPINMQTATHTLIITGSVYQGDFSQVTINNSSGNSNIFISGSLIGRTTGATATIFKATTGNITVIGNIIGQSAGGNNIFHTSTGLPAGTITISGSIEKRGAGIPISTTGPATTIVTGNLFYSGSITGPFISSTSTSGLVRVTTMGAGFNNFNPIYSPKIQLISTSTPTYTLQSDIFPRNVTFYDVAFTSSLPSQTNVRSGSTYGGSNEFSGSMIIPSASNVRYGVPVDNTTGSATSITPQDIFDYAVSSLTGSNTIGSRLQNISTVQTTAAVIAAFKGK
jgi:hypothetical protein